MHIAADDVDGQTRLAAFLQGLQETGWAVGRNVRVDIRWATANTDRFRSHAVDLLALAPDVVGHAQCVAQTANKSVGMSVTRF